MVRLCPHCKVTATFTRRWSNSSASRDGDIDPDKPLIFCDTCDNCESPICGVYPAGSTLDEPPWIWPDPAWIRLDASVLRETYADVPPAIADAAIEAHRALGAEAPRPAVAMARAVVEATAKEKGITVRGIERKIEQLAANGHISGGMREAAHEIRLTANEAAHGDLVNEPVSTEEASDVIELMDAILERVYQDPAKAARVRASREARMNRGERAQSPPSLTLSASR